MPYEFFNTWAPYFMRKLRDDFFLSDLDTAAIIGNAGHESAGFKSLQEIKPLIPGSKGGYGIMQWTGPRRREYEAYCKRNGLNPADMETNYKFLFVELKGPEGRVLPKLKEAKTLDAKTEVFMKVFLRPGIPHLDSRKIWAKRALDAYKKSLGGVGAGKPETPPVTNSEPKRGILELIFSIISKLLRK